MIQKDNNMICMVRQADLVEILSDEVLDEV
jgi:hypothetical protein